RLRFGLFEIDNDDAELIAEAMLSEPFMHVARKYATVPVQCSLAL
ncbi:EVE domain-containing protein, partial [Rhizobium ruizarguesonis]